MTHYWGVDLGVRSYTAAGIAPDGSLSLFETVAKLRGKVKDQSIFDRAHELESLGTAIRSLPMPGDVALVEEPPLAGPGNVRTLIKLAQVSAVTTVGMQLGGATTGLVSNSAWKKGTVGNGSASKELIARWLERTYPGYHAQCAGDQNRVDATCIAIYARTLHLGGAAAGGMDQARSDLAVG